MVALYCIRFCIVLGFDMVALIKGLLICLCLTVTYQTTKGRSSMVCEV